MLLELRMYCIIHFLADRLTVWGVCEPSMEPVIHTHAILILKKKIVVEKKLEKITAQTILAKIGKLMLKNMYQMLACKSVENYI